MTAPHHCHANGCNRACKPEMLMCYPHWRMVPVDLQRDVYRHYRKGQCDDKNPSPEWLRAARAAIDAVQALETAKAPGSTTTTPKTKATPNATLPGLS